jgi:hypothetical protein
MNLQRYFFFLTPLLFASCTDTFSKWCKITRGVKRVLSSTPPYRIGNKTYELHLKTKNYSEEEFISICQADTGEGVCCQAAEEGLL